MGTPKERKESRHSSTSCQVWCYNKQTITHSGKESFSLRGCGKLLSLGSSALHWWVSSLGCSAIIRLSLQKQTCNYVCVFPQVSASCPKDCQCPSEVPTCAAGVSLMLDACGCCKVCARQLFEDCSRTQPCDHTKGLECNFGGEFGSAKGICRGTVALLFSCLCFSSFAHFDSQPH